MTPRLHLVTLGVTDLPRATAFYEAIGFPLGMAEADGVAFFQLGPMILSLYPRDDLAADAGTTAGPAPAFPGFSLAHNVAGKAEVDATVATMAAAGGTVAHPAEDKPWGGYSAYVADPDGFLWEIAWNPDFPIAEDGAISLPG